MIILMLACLVFLSTLYSATFTPITNTDLIDAINTANTNNQDDVIDLSGGSPFTLTAADNGVNGLPVILADTNHTLLIENGIITRNSADLFRFIEIDIDAQVSLSKVTMQNGDAGPSDNGGAILVMGVLDSVMDCTFNNNHAAIGGAITVEANATINTVNNTTFNSNIKMQAGGALGISGSVNTISNSAFTSNNAQVGGAMFIFSSGTIDIIFNTTFANNSATISVGGAINNTGHINSIDASIFSRNAGLNGGALSLAQNQASSPIGSIDTISNSIFANNTASAFGGAIASITNDTTRPQSIGKINLCRFSNNFAFIGGALSLQAVSLTTIDRSTFAHNRATVSGGAFFSGSAKTQTISNSTFNDNHALSIQDGDGGALHLASQNDVPSSINTIVNSTFSGNTAHRFGGAIAMSTETGAGSAFIATLSNSTIASNGAQVSGGGFYSIIPSSIANLSSTIIATNTAIVSGPDTFASAGVINQESFNLIGNNADSALVAGRPNANHSYVGTALDPIQPSLFPLTDNGGPTNTRALQLTSVAIDHGDNILVLLYDQRGPNFLRTSGPKTDIGAFEVQQPKVCPDCPDCHDDDSFNDSGNYGFGPVGVSMFPPPPLPPPVPAPAYIPTTADPTQTTASITILEPKDTEKEKKSKTDIGKSGCSTFATENSLTLLIIIGFWFLLREVRLPRNKALNQFNGAN